MTIRDIFAINVRKHRHLRELSQEDLADRASIDRTYVSPLERGKYAATIDVVGRIAKALGVEVADLFARPASTRPSRKSKT